MFFEIGALTSKISLDKYLCWSLSLTKLGPQIRNVIKKRLQHKCLPVKFAAF